MALGVSAAAAGNRFIWFAFLGSFTQHYSTSRFVEAMRYSSFCGRRPWDNQATPQTEFNRTIDRIVMLEYPATPLSNYAGCYIQGASDRVKLRVSGCCERFLEDPVPGVGSTSEKG